MTVSYQLGTITVRADGLDDTKAKQYVAQVLGMLRGLDSTQTGHAVLNGIRWYKKELLIYPYDGSLGACNGAAYADWGMFRTKVTFTPYLQGGAHKTCLSDGKGAYLAGLSPLELLLHELTHAVRLNAGTFRKGVSQAEEEELAMLVTNIFSSETNQTLRTAYDNSTSPISHDHSGYAAKFYASRRILIEIFYKQHHDFTRWLARVKAPFNPMRLYFEEVRPPGW